MEKRKYNRKKPFILTQKRIEVLRRMAVKNKGSKKPHSTETKLAIKKTRLNKPIRNWKGGITYDENLYNRNRYNFATPEEKKKISWGKNARNRMLRNNIGSHTYEEWSKLKAQYNWTCPCCGNAEPKIVLTQDHIIPVVFGGSNNIENIQPLCRSCNSRKMIKIIKY